MKCLDSYTSGGFTPMTSALAPSTNISDQHSPTVSNRSQTGWLIKLHNNRHFQQAQLKIFEITTRSTNVFLEHSLVANPIVLVSTCIDKGTLNTYTFALHNIRACKGLTRVDSPVLAPKILLCKLSG